MQRKLADVDPTRRSVTPPLEAVASDWLNGEEAVEESTKRACVFVMWQSNEGTVQKSRRPCHFQLTYRMSLQKDAVTYTQYDGAYVRGALCLSSFLLTFLSFPAIIYTRQSSGSSCPNIRGGRYQMYSQM